MALTKRRSLVDALGLPWASDILSQHDALGEFKMCPGRIGLRLLYGFAGLLILVGLLVIGCGTSAWGADSSKTVNPYAGLVAIGGGRNIYLQCSGSGTPTVVLVSGTGGAHDEWTHAVDSSNPSAEPKPSESAVFPEVARFTRVCAYDRPGTTLFSDAPSPSTPVPQPTTAQAGAADLSALLVAAHEPGPYVLVGESWGGMLINRFARSNPSEVSGLVFCDAASDFLKSTLTPAQWTAWIRAVKTSPAGEVPDYDASIAGIRTAPPIPKVPAVVLTASKEWNLPVGDAGKTWSAWLAAQNDLARLLDARHITNTNSGHAINVEQPRLVAAAIHEVVIEARHHNR